MNVWEEDISEGMKFQKRQITLLWIKSMLLTRRRAPLPLKKMSIRGSRRLKTQRNVEVEVTYTETE